MTVGEVTITRENMLSFQPMIEEYKDRMISDLSELELSGLMQFSLKRNSEMDHHIVKTVARCYDLNQDQLNELEYLDALELFIKLYLESTTPKKKLGMQSSSPTTTTTSMMNESLTVPKQSQQSESTSS